MSPARAGQMRARCCAICAKARRSWRRRCGCPLTCGCSETAQTSAVSLRLLQHLVELIDDQVRERIRRHAAHHDGVGVVGFLRIRHRQQRPGARLERDRPVVVAPVEHVVVAGFLQKVGRDVALGNPRAEPAARRLAFMARDLGGRLGDQRALVRLGQLSLPLRIGAAMRGDLAAAPRETPRSAPGTRRRSSN